MSNRTYASQEAVIADGRQYLLPTYAQLPVVFTSGSGCTIRDMDGKEYLDFVAGIAVNSLGYGDEKLKRALKQVLDSGLTHCSNLYWNIPAVEAAALLADVTGLARTFFCNSGAEANEAALKLARKFGAQQQPSRAGHIISMKGSFHGRTYGAVTATGQEKYHAGFAPMLPSITYAQFNDLASVQSQVTKDTCAIIVEPVQGEGGIIPAKPEFLTGLREICDTHDLLLIFDEVQCGMGRTGFPLAGIGYGVIPDIATLAKGLGAGIPIGAMAAGKRAESVLSPGEHATTFGGNHLAAAAAGVVLKRLKAHGFLASVQKQGNLLAAELRKLAARYSCITEVRGIGLMQGIELSCAAQPVISACMQRGLLLVAAGTHVIRFVPPLVVTAEEIRHAVSILDEALAEVEDN